MATEAGYYMQPTIHGDAIVFVCEQALWTVAAGGGVARRLTTAPGAVAFPRFSADGQRLAYSARADGPMEIYVMDAAGGASRRLSHLGGMATHVVGWTAEDRAVIFRSNASRPFGGIHALYEVGAAGGVPKEIRVGPAREITRQPGGAGSVLGINTGDPARWKRYRGGTAGRLWVDRKGEGDYAPLIELDGNLSSPMWIGKRIYFLSDHEGHGNLYSCTPTGRSLKRHTDHDDFYARFPSTDGRRIVYHAGADLWLYDVATDLTSRVPVELLSARSGCERKYVRASTHLQSADIHPDGHSLACVSRGGAYTMGLWDGAPMRHGPGSSARQRLARWLPGGDRIVRVSDEKGEEDLVVCRADGTGRSKHIAGGFGRVLSLEVAPAGADRVALTDHRNAIWTVDLKTGKAEQIEQSEHGRINGFSWSPDGRWLAYGFQVDQNASALHLYDVTKKKVHQITRPDFGDFCPSFDPDGKYLYFLSHRVFDPVYDNHYFDLGFPSGVLPCLLTLAKDTPSPFSAATRVPRAPKGTAKAKAKGKTGEDEGKTVVHLRGIEDRIVAFPVPEARYLAIAGAPGRVLLTHEPIEGSMGSSWQNSGAPPAKTALQVYRFEDEKLEMLLRAMSGFSLSHNAKTLLVRVGNRLRALSATAGPKDFSANGAAGRQSGWLDLDRLRVEVHPGAEWRQMFDEAWRLQRDQFWVPDMSQINWQAVHARYSPLVDRVASRGEFSDLIWEMQGELGTSHCYEMGGDYKPSPRWHQGQLGADVAWRAKQKRWVITRIPRGDSWVLGSSSPLAAPGLGIREGDAILAVDGQTLSATCSPAMCLVNQAGREVVLTVQGAPKQQRKGKGRAGRTARRQVTIKTLANETMLRYRDWVETQRAHVHKASGGRVGYVHIPNMGPFGYSEFHRYFHLEVDRPGLIVDVRYNGGGHVSQLLLQKLARRRVGYGYARWRTPDSYPSHAPMGPMVALTNEFAGSDGDIFSHSFKLFGLGPLIGKRTWGGVVGIWPRHSLVDGTITTQPEFGHWFEDVAWGVENYGTDPDIDVDIKPQDWAAGRDPQMQRALSEVEKIIRREKRTVPAMGDKPVLKAPRLPTRD